MNLLSRSETRPVVAEATRSDGLKVRITKAWRASTNADIATNEPAHDVYIVTEIWPQGTSYQTEHLSEAAARAWGNAIWKRTRP